MAFAAMTTNVWPNASLYSMRNAGTASNKELNARSDVEIVLRISQSVSIHTFFVLPLVCVPL